MRTKFLRVVGIAAEAGVHALAWATAAGLAMEAFRTGSATHGLWMASTGVPAADTLLAGAFAVLVLLGRPRWGIAVVGTAVSALAAWGLSAHAAALLAGRIHATAAYPPATLVALVLVVPWTVRQGMPWFAGARRAPLPARGAFGRALGVVAAGLALVLLQIAAVGATDYRAEADAVLVLGAKVHADGHPSGSLADRTRTGCALIRGGYAPVLVLSGGKGPRAPVSEPEAMRRLAVEEGVPESALVLDESGVDTEASIRFTARLARERGWRRVLVVSNDYHLARVRLLAARENLVVRTVPAEETSAPWWKVAATGREVLAYAAAWACLGSR